MKKFVGLRVEMYSPMHGKILKRCTKTLNVKYQLQHGMKNLSYLMDYISKSSRSNW